MSKLWNHTSKGPLWRDQIVLKEQIFAYGSRMLKYRKRKKDLGSPVSPFPTTLSPSPCFLAQVEGDERVTRRDRKIDPGELKVHQAWDGVGVCGFLFRPPRQRDSVPPGNRRCLGMAVLKAPVSLIPSVVYLSVYLLTMNFEFEFDTIKCMYEFALTMYAFSGQEEMTWQVSF